MKRKYYVIEVKKLEDTDWHLSDFQSYFLHNGSLHSGYSKEEDAKLVLDTIFTIPEIMYRITEKEMV